MSLFQETSQFDNVEGHPNGKNMKKQNSPKMLCTTSYQKIDNVKYFRSPPTSSKPDPVIRNGCVFSVNSRDEDRLNKHRSELELHSLFVQELGARQEDGGSRRTGKLSPYTAGLRRTLRMQRTNNRLSHALRWDLIIFMIIMIKNSQDK